MIRLPFGLIKVKTYTQRCSEFYYKVLEVRFLCIPVFIIAKKVGGDKW